MSQIKGKQIAAGTVALTKLESSSTDNGKLIVTSSGVPAYVALSQDATLAANGAITIANNAITSDKINANAVTLAKLNADVISSDTSLPSGDNSKLPTVQAVRTYVDSVATGLDVKKSVRVASTADVGTLSTPTLSTGALVIDNVTVVEGNRVLLKDQDPASENGIYVVGASPTFALTRATDADNSPAGEVTSGMFTFVEQGDTNAATGWVLSTSGSITLDSTSLTFTQFSGGTAYTAGEGIALAGQSFSLDLNELSAPSGGVSVANDSVAIIDASATNASKKATISSIVSAMAGSGLSASNGQLSVSAGAGSFVIFETTSSALTASGDGNVVGSDTSLTIGQTPAAGATIQVFVNGIKQKVSFADKTGDCWFTADGTANADQQAYSSLTSTSRLRWSETNAGFPIESGDVVTIVGMK